MTRHKRRRFLQLAGIAVSLLVVGYAIKQVPSHTWSSSLSLMAELRPQTLWLMLTLELIVYAVITWSNQWLYRYCNVRQHFMPTLHLQLATDLANRLLPTAGASGIASWILLAHRLGVPMRRSVTFNGLGMVAGNALVAPIVITATLLSVTVAGTLRHSILWLSLLAALGVASFALPAAILLTESGYRFAFRRSSRWSLRDNSSSVFQHPTSRKRTFVLKIIRFRHDVRTVFRHGMRVWVFPFVAGCAIYALHVAILIAALNGLNYPISPIVVVLAYCMTNLVAFTTFLPTTIGVIDLSLTGSLHLLGVPLPVAISATLLYRLVTFWLPIPAGLYSLLVYFRKRKLQPRH